MFTVPESQVPQTPTPLYAGVFAGFGSVLFALVEGYFWISVYNSLIALIPADVAQDAQSQDSLNGAKVMLITVVVISGLIAVALAIGGVLALRRLNGGRIMMWIAGGITIAYHMCCSGYILIFRTAITAAIDQENARNGTDYDVSEHFPLWQVDLAVLFGFCAGLAAIAAVTLIAQRSVNQFYRALRTPPPQGGFAAPGSPGAW
ncbi:MAG TPA: hypothetical protein VE172_03175 [Stackebrandtia sp.]|jgi:hypothetical protein|uniref:hypothetical protein n=1 Tax=Stackebrandtia sp. TaxID=2023065 RepID=UPI002D3CBED5|nr:hypothetical protein [Stackebrandtia sp.]HZE37789.1 hypothetical protein [Stackebrandtia sp.]